MCVQLLSHIWLFATPWTVSHQASLSMGFPRQECWSRFPFPSPGDLPDPRTEPTSLAFLARAGRFFIAEPPWKPCYPSIFMYNWFTMLFNFRCAAVIPLYIYTIFLCSFLLLFITGYWISFPVLYSRTSLFTHLIYNGLHLLIPNSHTISPQPPCLLAATSLFSHLLVCFCFYVSILNYKLEESELSIQISLHEVLHCTIKNKFWVSFKKKKAGEMNDLHHESVFIYWWGDSRNLL